MNNLWSGMGDMRSSLLNAQQETRLRVEDLEGRLEVVDQKLSAALRLLASRLLRHDELACAYRSTACVCMWSPAGEGWERPALRLCYCLVVFVLSRPVR